MKIAIIGSTALARFLPLRVPKDLDIVGSYDDIIKYCNHKVVEYGGKIVAQYPASGGNKLITKIDSGLRTLIIEAEIAWSGSLSEELLEMIIGDVCTKSKYDTTSPDKLGYSHTIVEYYPSIDILYMLKMSHRYLKNSPHFLKTMEDIHTLRSMGAHIRECDQEFYAKRMEATYSYSHPSLMKSTSEFFSGDGVEYKYCHDDVHIAVAILSRPAYTFYQKAGAEVQCCKEKFFAVHSEVRLYGVLEEAYVLALERSIIPFGTEPSKAFKMALMKVCTSITSGWFREFAYEHYYEVCNLYEMMGDRFVRDFHYAHRIGAVRFFSPP
jgi:hypothetical protein